MYQKMCLVFLVVFTASCCAAQRNYITDEAMLIKDLPNPDTDNKQDWEKCGRPKTSFVCDPKNILEESEANQLDTLIMKVANETESPCANFYSKKDDRGFRITVAIIPRMALPAQEMKDDNQMKAEEEVENSLQVAKNFSKKLLNKWNPGQCNEGLVIIYSLYDNVLYTMTDEQSSLVLTSDLIGEISINRRAEVYKNIFDGLDKLINDYKLVFQGKYEKRSHVDPVEPEDPQAVVGGGSPILFSLTTVYMMLVSALISLIWLC